MKAAGPFKAGLDIGDFLNVRRRVINSGQRRGADGSPLTRWNLVSRNV